VSLKATGYFSVVLSVFLVKRGINGARQRQQQRQKKYREGHYPLCRNWRQPTTDAMDTWMHGKNGKRTKTQLGG
jgi:hypothetical protein